MDVVEYKNIIKFQYSIHVQNKNTNNMQKFKNFRSHMISQFIQLDNYMYINEFAVHKISKILILQSLLCLSISMFYFF